MAPGDKCIFKADWMQNESYEEWLSADSRVCNKSFTIANGSAKEIFQLVKLKLEELELKLKSQNEDLIANLLKEIKDLKTDLKTDLSTVQSDICELKRKVEDLRRTYEPSLPPPPKESNETSCNEESSKNNTDFRASEDIFSLKTLSSDNVDNKSRLSPDHSFNNDPSTVPETSNIISDKEPSLLPPPNESNETSCYEESSKKNTDFRASEDFSSFKTLSSDNVDGKNSLSPDHSFDNDPSTVPETNNIPSLLPPPNESNETSCNEESSKMNTDLRASEDFFSFKTLSSDNVDGKSSLSPDHSFNNDPSTVSETSNIVTDKEPSLLPPPNESNETSCNEESSKKNTDYRASEGFFSVKTLSSDNVDGKNSLSPDNSFNNDPSTVPEASNIPSLLPPTNESNETSYYEESFKKDTDFRASEDFSSIKTICSDNVDGKSSLSPDHSFNNDPSTVPETSNIVIDKEPSLLPPRKEANETSCNEESSKKNTDYRASEGIFSLKTLSSDNVDGKNSLFPDNSFNNDPSTVPETSNIAETAAEENCKAGRKAPKNRKRYLRRKKKREEKIPRGFFEGCFSEEEQENNSELKRIDEESKQSSASENRENEDKFCKQIENEFCKQLEIFYNDKGNACFKSGDYDSAIKFYTAGMELDPKNPLLAGNRAMAFLKKEEYQSAEDDFTLCLSINPSYVKAYLRRGRARKNLNKISLAAEDFLKVLEFEPDNMKAHRELKNLTGANEKPQEQREGSRSPTLVEMKADICCNELDNVKS